MKHSLASAILLVSALPVAAQSFFDWGTYQWEPTGAGSSGWGSQSYINVDGSGLDITVTISRSSASVALHTPLGASSIDNNSNFDGGFPETAVEQTSGASKLSIAHDLDAPGSYTQVTILFSQAVTEAVFFLMDIDRSDSQLWDDRVDTFSASGATTVSATVENLGGDTAHVDLFDTALNSVVATYSGSPSNLRLEGKIGDVPRNEAADPDDNDRDDSNVRIAFSNPAGFTEFSFRYTSGTELAPAQANDPQSQGIGMSGFEFTTLIPEPAGAIPGLLPLGLVLLRRRR